MEKALDCKSIRTEYLQRYKQRIKTFDKAPELLVIQIGNNEASNRYIKNKIKTCEEAGIKCVHNIIHNTNIDEKTLIQAIKIEQQSYDAVIVQCPLPKHINVQNVMNAIDPKKDCDGLNYHNIGLLHSGNPNIVPATAQGILDMLDSINYVLEGSNVLLVGRSQLVNQPLQALLTSGLFDVIISAIGKPKELAANADLLIDVGINFDENGKLCGDFDMKDCECDYFTPVPSGVGVLTQQAIVGNIIKCYELQHNK